MKIKWHIGCSGFHYKEWKNEFYPRGLAQSKWFDFYTQHFNTLELNVTFYRFPTLQSLKSWYDKAPAGFSFSAKVPRSITHFKKFEETEQMLKDFYQLLKEGLQEKLSCVLFQLPPQFSFSEERLEKILSQVDASFNNVIEFRNESWWREDVKAVLKKNDISFCGVSFPKITFDDAVINTPLCYYRFHGVPRLFYSEYDPAFIEKIFRQIEANKNVKEAFIYFNNTASLAALHNARYVQQLIAE
ncbi:MAG TPA: DUF72 domain-containing protein [Flavisolibacter sp.]|nr:DUF72 domain-containing protein [Flavisolibacter sp.]